MFRFLFAMQTISEEKTKIKGSRNGLFLPSLPHAVLEYVNRAASRSPESLHHMYVDHRRLDVRVAEVLASCVPAFRARQGAAADKPRETSHPEGNSRARGSRLGAHVRSPGPGPRGPKAILQGPRLTERP
jgi:hypothetical protein